MADLAQVEPAVIEAQNGLTLSIICMILLYSFILNRFHTAVIK